MIVLDRGINYLQQNYQKNESPVYNWVAFLNVQYSSLITQLSLVSQRYQSVLLVSLVSQPYQSVLLVSLDSLANI